MAVDAVTDDARGAAPTDAERAADLRERLLLARLRRRDARAFAELVHAHQDRVFGLCLRMLGDREEASDVAQEVFEALHAAVARFRGDSRLSTWIYKVAKNRCLNRLKHLKRRGHDRTQPLDAVHEAELSAQPGHPGPAGPQEALLEKEQQARVQAAIARLPEDQRLLVVLRDIEGLTYDEIAAIAELPEGTVKSRLHRARAALVELLTPLMAEDES